MLTSRRIGRTRVTPLRAPTPSAGTQAAALGCGVTPQTQARDGSTAQYRSALQVYLHLTYLQTETLNTAQKCPIFWAFGESS